MDIGVKEGTNCTVVGIPRCGFAARCRRCDDVRNLPWLRGRPTSCLGPLGAALTPGLPFRGKLLKQKNLTKLRPVLHANLKLSEERSHVLGTPSRGAVAHSRLAEKSY
jgi:hypothetical protein